MFFQVCARELNREFWTSKRAFSPLKRPMEGSWCGKPRSAARYRQLSELSQKKDAAIIHARHCKDWLNPSQHGVSAFAGAYLHQTKAMALAGLPSLVVNW